jgi:hypothetical protein
MRMTRSRSISLAFLSLVAVAACSHARDAATDSTVADSTPPATAPSTSAAVTPASSSAASTDAPITVADIDAWQKGMTAELEAVQDAGTARQNAKNATDTLNAMFGANDMSTRAAGAKGAGMSEARYQYVSNKLSSIVGNLSPVEAEMNMKDMPESFRKQMQESREQSATQEMAGMAPDVQAALRTRAADLRKQSLELAGARLKAAGAVH